MVQSPQKIMGQSKKNSKTWEDHKNLISLFGCHDQSFVFGRETEILKFF